MEQIDFDVATHEARQAARRRRAQTRAHGAGRLELEDVNERVQTLNRRRTERKHVDESLGQGERGTRDEDRAGVRDLLHSRCEMRRLPYRRVIHMEVVPDGTHHDVARIQPDPHTNAEALGPTNRFGIPIGRLLEGERRVARAHRVVFVSERRAEQRHDPVTHHLVDGALVAVDGLHHQLEDGIEKLPSLLGITVSE
jgi:hypothetical protein